MTKPTDTRTLRLLISGVLSIYEIDNLELEIKLAGAVKRFLDEGQAEPVRTKEKILDDLRRGIERGSANHEIKENIFNEIKRRVGISPVGKEWEDFIEFAFSEQKQGRTIDRFLDWWLADEWQATHPPSRPAGWHVKWLLAFKEQPELFVMNGSVHA